jgi:hypothetical protein
MVNLSERHPLLRISATVGLALECLASLAVTVYGAYLWGNGTDPGRALGFLAGGTAGLLGGVLLYGQWLLLLKLTNYTYRLYDALLESTELLRRQEEHGRMTAENSHLSEWAKRIVYREKDFEFLRDTIHGAIVRQDWEAAEHLIGDVDTEFGYHDAAAKFRAQLEQARKATKEERVAAVLSRFDELCDQQKWTEARRDCDRLQALFPEDARIGSLPNEIEVRRQEYKRKLLGEYEDAVQNQDVDRAHKLLYALDQYLLPKEAEAIKPSARNVFRARMEQIRTQFSIAVTDKQFSHAIEAGERLIREFPNSGYAQEITKLLPILRTRARQQDVNHAVPVRVGAP